MISWLRDIYKKSMFTGIIEGLGTVTGIRNSEGARQFAIQSDFFLKDIKTGDSIAVNGACLTAVAVDGNRFSADVSPETLNRTTFNRTKIGERVNLERALRLSDRLDGHLVSGHIDGMAIIVGKQKKANAIIVSMEVSEYICRYLIEKGSVAIDGISLTVNMCRQNYFDVSIIPHTASLTTIGIKQVGEYVNIETDMIGKYVERFLNTGVEKDDEPKSVIDKELLARTGFL